MANTKKRFTNTKFWNDKYISELDTVEKLLFIYLLTNEHTNISGIYEVPLKVIAIETGIDVSMLEKMLSRIEDKIRYIDGYVVIKNFIKHQQTSSPTVVKGIINCLEELDQSFLIHLVDKGFYQLTQEIADSLCIAYTQAPRYLDSNSHLDSNSNSKSKKTATKEIALKSTFGEFENVKLTPEEHQKLINRIGEEKTNTLIEELGTYMASKNKRYASHYATLLNWSKRKETERNYKTKNVRSI